MSVYLKCSDCEHTWVIFGKIIKEHEEEVIEIGKFDDICPICGTQGDVFDLTEDQTTYATPA